MTTNQETQAMTTEPVNSPASCAAVLTVATQLAAGMLANPNIGDVVWTYSGGYPAVPSITAKRLAIVSSAISMALDLVTGVHAEMDKLEQLRLGGIPRARTPGEIRLARDDPKDMS